MLPGPEGESCGFLHAGHALSLLMGIWGSSQWEEEAVQAAASIRTDGGQGVEGGAGPWPSSRPHAALPRPLASGPLGSARR